MPAAVTVRDRGELDARFVEDIRDLAREEPGVSVRRAPARFGLALASTGRAGNEGFNIRGIEGNRVLILVDGVRVPNAFSFGANSFGRGDYFDLSLASRVEILRGPASALYGSDGLAGAVSFTTPDPADLLARSRGDRHLGWRVAYD
ncbi:MAG: TonB-dependent receptor plug domain-containing protein, partial [Burkholderiaceae bacterium]|nr:TonB-dependent receptor plug domain-containing protein [Burkholderiaceae bacterium]